MVARLMAGRHDQQNSIAKQKRLNWLLVLTAILLGIYTVTRTFFLVVDFRFYLEALQDSDTVWRAIQYLLIDLALILGSGAATVFIIMKRLNLSLLLVIAIFGLFLYEFGQNHDYGDLGAVVDFYLGLVYSGINGLDLLTPVFWYSQLLLPVSTVLFVTGYALVRNKRASQQGMPQSS